MKSVKMNFWWYIGIGAGAIGAGFLVFKIIPAIAHFIQYRRYLKQLRQKDFEKNLARIKEQNKQLAIKRTKRQERKLARAQTKANLKNLIKEAKEKMAENSKKAGKNLKNLAIKAGNKGLEVAKHAKDGAKVVLKNARDKTKEAIANAKEQQKIQVIKTAQEHMPAPSPAQTQYENAILAKEEEILRLKNKGHLNKQEQALLQQYEKEVLSYRMVNPKPAEPTIIVKEQKPQKEPLTLASPQPEYDLSVMENKINRFDELSSQENLSKEQIQEMKTLKKETEKFFSGNPDYQIAYLNKKIHNQQQILEHIEHQRPSEIEKQNEQELKDALEKFENENPTLGKRLKNYLQKNKNKNN